MSSGRHNSTVPLRGSFRASGGPLALGMAAALLSAVGCTGDKGGGGDDTGGGGGFTPAPIDFLEPDPDAPVGSYPWCIANAVETYEAEFKLYDPTVSLIAHEYISVDDSSSYEFESCRVYLAHPDMENYVGWVVVQTDPHHTCGLDALMYEYDCEVDTPEELLATAPSQVHVDAPQVTAYIDEMVIPGYQIGRRGTALFGAGYVKTGCVSERFFSLVPDSLDPDHPILAVGAPIYPKGGVEGDAGIMIAVDGRTGGILGSDIVE